MDFLKCSSFVVESSTTLNYKLFFVSVSNAYIYSLEIHVLCSRFSQSKLWIVCSQCSYGGPNIHILYCMGSGLEVLVDSH